MKDKLITKLMQRNIRDKYAFLNYPKESEIAALYFDCGYQSVADFSVQTAEGMQQKIANYIEKTGSNRSVPLKKELATQIAVSQALPHLLKK